MKVAIYGAGGTIGSRILNEAISRYHAITVIARNPEKFRRETTKGYGGRKEYAPSEPAKLRGIAAVQQGDALNPDDVIAKTKGHDAVICSIGGEPEMIRRLPETFLSGMEQSGVRRLLVVGGAGSLEIAPGIQLLEAPGFPEAYRPVAEAHREFLYALRRVSHLDWTYLSPAAEIHAGERTGKFRLGGDNLLADASGRSRISAEDYAIALLDELENPQHIRQRFTVAY